jgi:hypothetical protein
MRFRKLRIAWSVAWGIACVLLLVLWVRSYSILYWCYGLPHGGEVFHLQAAHGKALLFNRQEAPGWKMGSIPLQNCGAELFMAYQGYYSGSYINVEVYGGNAIASFPIWPWLIAVLLVTIAPWLPNRFTLRTLLIAMTLIAAVLGLIVWFRS